MALVRRLAGVFGKERRERELAEEIASHLALHIEENLNRGMSREEARRQALIRLGGIEMTKEIYREQRGLPVLETLLQDVRFGLRMLWKNRGFTVVAVLVMATEAWLVTITSPLTETPFTKIETAIFEINIP